MKPHGHAGQPGGFFVAANGIGVAAEGGPRQDDVRHHVNKNHHHNGRRDEADRAGGEYSKAVIEAGYRPAFREHQRGAAGRAHHPQCRDERRQSANADERTIEHPAGGSCRQGGGERDRQRVAGLQHGAERDPRQRDNRSDRQVDAAGNDHEGHPDGDNGVDAGLLGDVQQIRDRQKVRRERPQHRAQDSEADDGSELSRPQHARPRAALSTRSCVASAALNSAWMRPRHITRIRSLMPSSSGSSDEIMMIPAPDAVRRLIRW